MGLPWPCMLAILDDDSLSHPAAGMCLYHGGRDRPLWSGGSRHLPPERKTPGSTFDSEKEGIFTVSCAGGMECDCVLPAAWQEADGCFYEIWVDGLHGGHSGSDIHKERANSNILMGRLLCMLDEVVEFRLAELAGGPDG